ncbi:hypothetical protein ACHAWF_007496 [Thalassiosira exigua]
MVATDPSSPAVAVAVAPKRVRPPRPPGRRSPPPSALLASSLLLRAAADAASAAAASFATLPPPQPQGRRLGKPRAGAGAGPGRAGISSSLGFWDSAGGRIDDDPLPEDGALDSSLSSDPDVDWDVPPEPSESESRTIENGSSLDRSADSPDGARTTADDAVLEDVPDAIGNETARPRRRRDRWRRLSSLPGLLPGRPLFLWLVPVKPGEIISRIINEIPECEVGPTDRENVDCEVAGEEVEDKEIKSWRPQAWDEAESDTPNNLHNGAKEPFNETYNLEQMNSAELSSSPTAAPLELATGNETDGQGHNRRKERRFFRLGAKRPKRDNNSNPKQKPTISKAELECPAVATGIHDLQSAVLVDKVPLRDVGFRFPAAGVGSEGVLSTRTNATVDDEGRNATRDLSTETIFTRDDPVVNGSLSSLLTHDAKTSSDPLARASYQRGIDLVGLHPVLSVVRERAASKSKPGNRRATSPDDTAHLALVIEGGGMRGAVSAGMAAALSTLDLLDAFDSIHGSSAGAIVGAYLVSRQLCTDIYTDIMPAAGSKFASKRRGMVNFGVDWLGDLIQRQSSEGEPEKDGGEVDDGFCVAEDDSREGSDEDDPSWWCEDDVFSSVELAMEPDELRSEDATTRPSRRWSDDHYDGVLFESMNYLFANAMSRAGSSLSKPISFGVRRFGRALRPALSALDVAASLRQYLKKRPGMNLTYVLDGVMDETHGLRPFDVDAFRTNDKRQPLYIIASTVNEGGSGEMETVAFNSAEGDFFGFMQEDSDGSSSSKNNQVSWYRRMWTLFQFVPYTIFSAVRKALFAGTDNDTIYQPKDHIETEALPAGTSAMYGFSDRHRVRKLSRPQEDKPYDATGRVNDEGKKGIFPCLEASMLVPAAAGPPIQLIRSKNRKFIEQRSRFPMFRPRKELARRKESNSHLCYDAFCYEPIPYRSAVEKAKATHVLALRSRPDGCSVETRQHMYERVVGPIYFRKHGMPEVAKLFSSGGSQYRYIEDVLTLNEGLAQGIAMGAMERNGTTPFDQRSLGVKVPPTRLFYGNPSNPVDSVVDINDWKRAHLLPITLPYGTPELPALSQDKDEVMRAVRNGYAAAFDVLAPAAGLPFDSATITGERVAKLLFPDGDDDVAILNKPMRVKPSYIGDEEETKRRSFAAWITGKREAKRKAKDEIDAHPDGALARRVQRRTSLFHETDQYVRDETDTLEYIETEALLAALPGFQGGRLDHIADSLLANEERKRKSETGA